MNRHQLAQSLLPGLLASGHFTKPGIDGESPWIIVETYEDIAGKWHSNVPVIKAAYKLADLMIKEAVKP